MRIESIEVHPVRAPRHEAVRASPLVGGISASEFGIIRVRCEGGYTGLGEISITYPRIGFSLCHAARALVAPALTGENALDVPRILGIIDRVLLGELSSTYLRAAFEMALLDLTGKRYGIPVYQLLGGSARERVPLAWAIYQKSPDEMAEDAKKAVAGGFQAESRPKAPGGPVGGSSGGASSRSRNPSPPGCEHGLEDGARGIAGDESALFHRGGRLV